MSRISAKVIFWGAPSSGPIDLCRPLHRRAVRVLDLDPVRASAATIGAVPALANKNAPQRRPTILIQIGGSNRSRQRRVKPAGFLLFDYMGAMIDT
jgi:hypothetical protein